MAPTRVSAQARELVKNISQLNRNGYSRATHLLSEWPDDVQASWDAITNLMLGLNDNDKQYVEKVITQGDDDMFNHLLENQEEPPQEAEDTGPPAKQARQDEGGTPPQDSPQPGPSGEQNMAHRQHEPMDDGQGNRPNQQPGEDNMEVGATGGGSHWMAGDSSGEGVGKLDANFQKPNKMFTVTKKYTKTFEHSISENTNSSFYKTDNGDGAYARSLFKVPYYLMRSSMGPNDFLDLRSKAYVAKLKNVGFTITGAQAIETVIGGSDDNPKLRAKTPPKCKVQYNWSERGMFTDGRYYEDNDSIADRDFTHHYQNNRHMTNERPLIQHSDTGRLASEDEAVLPNIQQEDCYNQRARAWVAAMFYDTIYCNPAHTGEMYKGMDVHIPGDLDHCVNPIYDPEAELLTTSPLEDLVGKSFGVDTHHQAWLFVNKVSARQSTGVIGGYYFDNLNNGGNMSSFCDDQFLQVINNEQGRQELMYPTADTPQNQIKRVYAGTAKGEHLFPCWGNWNRSWHDFVYNDIKKRTEGPTVVGYPEFVLKLNKESDRQGSILRSALLTIQYHCTIEYIPIELPPNIKHPVTNDLIVRPPYTLTSPVDNPWNHFIRPITVRNPPVMPIGLLGCMESWNGKRRQREGSWNGATKPTVHAQFLDTTNSSLISIIPIIGAGMYEPYCASRVEERNLVGTCGARFNGMPGSYWWANPYGVIEGLPEPPSKPDPLRLKRLRRE